MKINKINLPIFPLSVFLLPEGMTKLRIFEPRYLKMVSIALKGQGFIIWARGDDKSLSNSSWGSWVEVMNFDQGSDGVLEIDVKCKSLVRIKSLETDKDNLHFGDVTQMVHWSQSKTDVPLTDLSKCLKDVFANNIDLDDLYLQKETDSAGWVIARWLELLPVNLDIKASFVVEHNFEEAKEFVQSVLDK
jgi:Lon protease-like protein